MREPSIHINKSVLIQLLNDMGIKDIQIVNYLLTEGRKYSLNNRIILVTNDKLDKKAQKMIQSSSGDAMTMAKTIYNVRKSLKHRGVIITKANDRDWGIVKDIASNALEFCNDFQLTKSNGFIEYIKTAALKMSKFGLTKIPSMHNSICQDYEALSLLRNDKNSDLTERAFRKYNELIIKQLGEIMVDYKKIPEKYVCFMQVGIKCKELNIKPEIYIQAQFDGLGWTKGVPDPLQLIGDKAMERLQKYLYQNSSDEPEEKVKNKTIINRLNSIKRL